MLCSFAFFVSSFFPLALKSPIGEVVNEDIYLFRYLFQKIIKWIFEEKICNLTDLCQASGVHLRNIGLFVFHKYFSEMLVID